MRLYGAIDLHSNNSFTVLLDEQDRVVYQKRCPNDLAYILSELSPYQAQIEGIAVESTYNWYWLVDGLMEKGYRVHLVNTTAVQQYNGLKYTDDEYDARWLAHLLRLGILPEGHIYPKESRAVRDLLRKRSQLVQQRTAHILSIQNLISRNTGQMISSNTVKQITLQAVKEIIPETNRLMAVQSNRTVMMCLDEEIKKLEKGVLKQSRMRPEFKPLLKPLPPFGGPENRWYPVLSNYLKNSLHMLWLSIPVASFQSPFGSELRRIRRKCVEAVSIHF